MSSNTAAPPAASSLNLAGFKQILSLYDKTAGAFYQTKVKDDKKRITAIETDKWRFDVLPDEVTRWTEKENGLTLQQLQRLVEWKITHGKYRPFLPGQIRKNTPAVVPEVTSAARQILLSNKTALSEATLKQSLDKVCTLNGVGPATGTLLLSIFNPKEVPFFQDELFAWTTVSGDQKTDVKLKYNVKEYLTLLEQVNQIRTRLGRENVDAWEVEKVGYVIGHWDLVTENDASKVLGSIKHGSAPLNESNTAQHPVGISAAAKGSKRKLQDEHPVQSVQDRDDPTESEVGTKKKQKKRESPPSPQIQLRSDSARKSQRIRKQRG